MFFANGALLAGWIAHLTDIKLRLGLEDGQLGALLLCSAFGAVMSMPLASLGIHRFGSRRWSLTFGLALALVVPWIVVAPSPFAVGAILFLLGASNGQMDVAMNAHSLAVQGHYPRPILSSVHGWFSVGGFAGGAFAAVSGKLGLAAWQHLAVASFLWLVVLAIARSGLLPGSVDKDADGAKIAIPRGPALVIGLMTFIAFITEGAVWDWSSVYVRLSLGADFATGAIALSAFQIGMAVSRFFGDAIVHRIGPAWTFMGSGVFAGLSLGLAMVAPHPWLAIAGFAATGLGLANSVPILFRAAGSLPGIPAGLGIAMVATCGYTGLLAGPPLVGGMAQLTSLRVALTAMAIVFVLTALYGRRLKSASPD